MVVVVLFEEPGLLRAPNITVMIYTVLTTSTTAAIITATAGHGLHSTVYTALVTKILLHVIIKQNGKLIYLKSYQDAN